MFVGRFLADREMARDVTQDLFIKLWEIFRSFNSLESIRAFLYRSARNALINYADHEKVKALYESREQYKEQVEQDFLSGVIEEETHRIIYQAIQQLPEGRRQIILLSLQGHSNQEIVALLGVSLNTVKTQKSKAYQQLRTILKQVYLLKIFFPL